MSEPLVGLLKLAAVAACAERERSGGREGSPLFIARRMLGGGVLVQEALAELAERVSALEATARDRTQRRAAELELENEELERTCAELRARIAELEAQPQPPSLELPLPPIGPESVESAVLADPAHSLPRPSCSRCGAGAETIATRGAWLEREGPGAPWRCAPSCAGSGLSGDDLVVAAIEGSSPATDPDDIPF